MSETDGGQDDRVRAVRWRRVATTLAVVAAVFSATVVGVMAAAYVDEPRDDPMRSRLLDALRTRLAQSPTDTVVKEHIRDIDLAMRDRYFRYRRRFRVGAVMLGIGILAMVVCLRWRWALDPRVPQVERRADMQDDETGWTPARQNMLAVAAVGLAIGLGVWAMMRARTEPYAVAPIVTDGPRADVGPATRPGDPPAPTATTRAVAPATQAWDPVAFAAEWPQFRGPTGMGVVKTGRWPTHWDAKTGKNVIWKCAIPLPGNSSPVLWGDRLYLTSATAKRRVVYAVDRRTGTIVWTTDIPTKLDPPLDEIFEETGYAAPTPVTNGRHVVAMFATSDVVGLDAQGRIVWARGFGRPDSQYGLASSLVLYRNTAIVQLDQGSDPEQPKSTLMALDVATGQTVWEAPRDVPNSWSTPLVVHTGTREVLLTCANPWVIAYEPDSSVELWRAKVLAGDVAPMAVFAGGRIYVTNESACVAALKPGGKGDVTDTHVLWTADQGMSDLASPVCDGRWFLQMHTSGWVTCFDAATGKLVWEKTFDCGFMASPTLIGGRVYLPGDDGVTSIFALGPTCKVESTGTLGEKRHASTVCVGSRLYIRGLKHLFCIGEKDSP